MNMKRKALFAALAALPLTAWSADGDDARDALTKPVNTIEAGGLMVTSESAKFGEYNGLDKKGGYFIGNIELFGGRDDSAYRWRLFGFDLGLDTRTLGIEAGSQGSWRVTAGYEEVPHRYSDTYKTLWNGAGGTSLTLPAGYPAASTRLAVTNTSGGILANWNNLQAPNATATSTGGGPGSIIPGLMQQVDIGTERKRTNVGVATVLGKGWEFSGGVRHEEKEGIKLTGSNMGRFSGISALMPEPIHSNTNLFDARLSYVGERMQLVAGYLGSIYNNDIKLWTVENAGANNVVMNNVSRFQSYPDNQMHQLNLQGAYVFSPLTKLVVTGSYSRMTQNDNFIDNPAGSTWTVPVNSVNAKVIQSFLSARLTSRPMKGVTVNASYKFEDRDNRTPVYTFLTTAGDVPGASTQFSNEPLNRRLSQVNLDGEYQLRRGEAVRAEYEYQEIKRTADSEESPFRADRTTENTVRFAYRKTLDDNLTGRVSYAYSRRRVSDYEQGDPRPTSPAAPLPAADPALTGFEQFFLADRNRDKLRSQLNWQASDQVTVQGTLDYNRDKYQPQFGLKEARSWVATVDAGYTPTENLAFTLFYSYEDTRTRMESLAIARGLTTTTLVQHVSGPPCASYTNAANTLPADYATDPCRMWAETQDDRVHTLGLNGRYKGLLGGRLVLTGQLTFAKATTPIGVTGGTYYSNGVPNSPTANFFIPAASFPDIVYTRTDLRLQAGYAIDKASSVRFIYWYGRLKADDWAYDAYTNSALGVLAIPTYLGPGMTAPNYTVSVVGASYTYRFR